MSGIYEGQLSGAGSVRWVGAGGPAYYLEGSQPERVIAILYWTEAFPSADEEGVSVTEARWCVVFTHNGELWEVDDAPPLDESDDQAASQTTDAAIEAAMRLIESEL